MPQPARPLCGSHLGSHDVRQPVALVILFNGLCPAVRPAPDRAPRYTLRAGYLRHHPSRAVQIGALVRISVCRIRIAMASACPVAQDWGAAPQSGSQSPPSPAPRQQDTRCPGALPMQLVRHCLRWCGKLWAGDIFGSGYAKHSGGVIAYAAAKHPVVGMTLALAYQALLPLR